jgi:hypothetical protein
MPTSGTGSLWRIITTIAGPRYKTVKITEQLEGQGKAAEIPAWRPEPFGHLYMYNTPHYVNKHMLDPAIRLVTNFRDPRDLACNQFHWALQHPIANRSEEYIENYRRNVEANGIDAFVAKQDNTILFNSLKAIAARLDGSDPNVLTLSYAQLCLDFDDMLRRLAGFFEVPADDIPWARLEQERTTNLAKNPAWIGQIWTGTDIMPGRYRKELKRETINVIDQRYAGALKFLRALEPPHLRALLATEAERAEMERVLVGRNGQLFLRNDANNTVGQITGTVKLSQQELIRIGMAHRTRQVFGELVGDFAYLHAIIPSKEVVHRADLPAEVVFEQHGGRPLQQYAAAGLMRLWRPYYEPAILEPTDEKLFFPRSDSHWNHAGALRYLKAFLAAESSELSQRAEAVPLREFGGRQQGDLGLKIELAAEPIDIIAPQKSQARLVFENGINNEGCIRWYKNPSREDGSVALVLHDSFTLWLLGLLPELFAETVFFHGTIFDYEFAANLAPRYVLCLQAERFFTRAPVTGSGMLDFVAQEEQDKAAKTRFADFLKSDPRFGEPSQRQGARAM